MATYQNKFPRLGWSACEFMADFLTTTLVGVTGVSWGVKQDKENLYGAGNEPIAYGLGKIENEASITLYRDEVQEILAAIPSGRLVDATPFNLVISFTPEGSADSHIVELSNCQFMEDKFSVKQGDKMIEQELPLLVGRIKFDGR